MAEDNTNQAPLVPIRYHFRPTIQAHYSGIARGTINANNFELKPALINMVQQNQFNGSATVDPHLHLRTFLEITDMVKMNGVLEDIILLLDSAAGGTIFAKDPVHAYDMLEQMMINSFQWPSERIGVKKPVGVYNIDPITSITAQLSALTTQVAALNKGSVAE
ncbi:uncharacterized protein [Henckelia pumila]|uniref:uncharacterized protein n=1 Tax=Henckelia pumila TaxID=405737 RepID=UPI003C6E3A5C